MKYTTIDQNNLPTAFYDKDIHGDKIPADALPLTDDQWRECLDNQGRRKVIDNGDDTSRLENYTPPLPPLADYAESAKTDVDLKAGEVRTRFPSPGELTAEEYMQTETEAQAFKDAGYPSADVPDEVQSWADATGMTAQEACDDILQTAVVWRTALAQIRRERLVGKANIDSAADHAAVDTARANAETALDAITPESVAASLA